MLTSGRFQLIANRRRLLAALVVAWLLGSGPARAQDTDDSKRLQWADGWRRVGPPEYAATAVLMAGVLITNLTMPPPNKPKWTRPVLMDRHVREAVVLRDRDQRAVAATVSDGLVTAAIAQPLVIDPLLVAGVGDRNSDVAWQLFVISAQSQALSLFANDVAKRVFARARPYAEPCERDITYGPQCTGHDRYRSFYSGHSAMSATSAGLTCASHTHLSLYGGGWADRSACIGAVGLAMTTGFLRIVADRHWTSDVLVGWLLGGASGFVLPSLIYYKGVRRDPVASAPAALAAPMTPQLVVGGAF